jgi:Hemerythrin HHE cation binding domain
MKRRERAPVGDAKLDGRFPGPIFLLMREEHVRLDELLSQASDCCGAIDQAAYQSFRERLLRHIKIEEKILIPMCERRRGGRSLPIASRLRLDHGALAALMMLPPAAPTFRAIRAVLEAHNPLEEGQGGAYEQCDRLVGSERNELLARCAAAPPVPTSPWVDNPKVLAATKRSLARAGYEPALLDAAGEESE